MIVVSFQQHRQHIDKLKVKQQIQEQNIKFNAVVEFLFDFNMFIETLQLQQKILSL